MIVLLSLALLLQTPQDPSKARLESSPRHHEWIELERGGRKLRTFVAFPEVKAKVPAVLIELAYVTNAQDAQNLKSQSWREKVSESIATAIDDYFTDQVARLPM